MRIVYILSSIFLLMPDPALVVGSIRLKRTASKTTTSSVYNIVDPRCELKRNHSPRVQRNGVPFRSTRQVVIMICVAARGPPPLWFYESKSNENENERQRTLLEVKLVRSEQLLFYASTTDSRRQIVTCSALPAAHAGAEADAQPRRSQLHGCVYYPLFKDSEYSPAFALASPAAEVGNRSSWRRYCCRTSRRGSLADID